MQSKEIIIKKLKTKGVKVTPQRVAIINFLEKNRIHPSADDIYNGIVKEYPSISLATIYNTLDKLEEIGKIIKLKVADDHIVNYEYNLTPHQHFYCRKCGKIYDIEIEQKYQPGHNLNGHQIEECHTFFKGLCKNCK